MDESQTLKCLVESDDEDLMPVVAYLPEYCIPVPGDTIAYPDVHDHGKTTHPCVVVRRHYVLSDCAMFSPGPPPLAKAKFTQVNIIVRRARD